MTRRSTRLDTLVAIIALALPFALPVLVVAWTSPAIVVTCAPRATASAEPCDRRTPTPTATAAPTATAEPTSTPGETPTTSPTATATPTATPTATATATPTGAVSPTSTPEPTQGPSVTEPPTATVVGSVEPNIDDSVTVGFLVIVGLAVVFLAVGRRWTAAMT